MLPISISSRKFSDRLSATDHHPAAQLPPGLEYRPLPPDLIVQLPPLAPDYRYVIADDRVLLIRVATNVILDLLEVPAL